jgi:carboxylesterase
MEKPIIIQSAEPFLFPGNRTGCLVIHGFTGTPKEMRPLGEYLASKGFTVLGPRLTGHAMCPPDMIRSRWQDWLASVEDGLHLLSGMTDRIYVLGLSMGGVLALISASRYPVQGAVAMSTPYRFPDDWRVNFLRPLSLFMPYVNKGPSDWQDPENLKTHVSYPKYPTRSLAELKLLFEQLQNALPQIRVPVLLMQSRDDTSILPDSMEHIFDRLGTSSKKMLWLEGGGHVITREPCKETVFQTAHEFILEIEKQLEK